MGAIIVKMQNDVYLKVLYLAVQSISRNLDLDHSPRSESNPGVFWLDTLLQ